MNDNLPMVPSAQEALPTDPQALAEYYRRFAEAQAAQEQRGGATLSMRNGILAVGDQPMPGNQLAAIVLDSVRLNTFYDTPFNASNPQPPRCYAVGRTDAEMRPHPDMAKDPNWFQPQSDACATCPLNQWGSGPNGGKACTNRRRLVLLPAGTYQNGVLQPILDPNHYQTTTALTMLLPPTNLGAWGEYVRNISAQFSRPTFAMIVRLYLHPHPKHGKETLGFDPIGPVPDAWFPVLHRRAVEAASTIMEGYDPPRPQAQAQAQQMQRGGGFYQQQAQGFAQQPQGFAQQPQPQGFVPAPSAWPVQG